LRKRDDNNREAWENLQRASRRLTKAPVPSQEASESCGNRVTHQFSVHQRFPAPILRSVAGDAQAAQKLDQMDIHVTWYL
jgi:hypothetical protein